MADAPDAAPYTVARYLVDRLVQCGLRHLFAVPGDYASRFLDAVDAEPAIVRVPTIAELGSGYAADGYARLAGIGAACVQYGVGTFSALNCAAGSFVERVPVAIISASPSTQDRVLEASEDILFHHSTGDLDADRDVFAAVTVASEIIATAASAPEQIDEAIVAMLTHRRPIYIEVLQDIWIAPCARPQGRLAPQIIVSEPAALAGLVEAAWAEIEGAEQPVLWAGVEVQRYGLQARLQRLIDASGFPFATTSLGKTMLDEAQPQFVGTYAGPASLAITRAIVDGSDCPIALGAIITDDYLNIMAARFSVMISVNDEEARVGWSAYPGVFLGDFLDALAERFEASSSYPRAFTPPTVPEDADEEPAPPGILTYNRFFRALVAFLDADERVADKILVLGESTSLYVFGNAMGLPRDSFVAQAAWGSLGHETGSALGIGLATGKRPFVVAGDGGFMMVCQEISSLVRAKVPAAIFVMSNRGYAIEQAFVNLDAFTPKGSFAPYDELPAWDYLALAQAFGARGFRVSTETELATALGEIEEFTDGPALVEVVIPPKDLAPQLRRLAEVPASKAKSDRTRSRAERHAC
ncbi:MAG TPA: thiamine pyrophosphate-dependent enzyme [Allosphingosinicella sp.]|jgi:indolepyruvate decarboxylase